MSALTSKWVRTLFADRSQLCNERGTVLFFHADPRHLTMSAEKLVQSPGAEEKRPVAKSDDASVLADVRAAARGDGDAYSRIIGRYQQTIARRMHRFTRDPAAIEELVHDVFVEAYFSLCKYRGEAPLEHWLQKIATRVGYKYWERRQREKTIPFQDGMHDPPAKEDGVGNDEAEEVGAALEKLSPRDRLVLTLLYLESRSVAEAADLAGWSQTMVKVQAHRARGKLRKLLAKTNDSTIGEGESHGRD
jgi:RNA polymerase sigma-70 factor (ECF subfamily)